MGRSSEAIASMQRARESEPLSSSVNMYLGVAQTHAGHYDLAIRQLQQAIELDPHYYRPYMFLGRVFMFTGRSQEAIDSYQTALSINPDNLEALAFMGSAKAVGGDRQGALRIIKRVIAAENRTEPAVLVASIYASLGDASAMFEWLERAVERRSTPIYIALISAEFRPYKTDPRFHDFLDSIGLSNLAKA
jgi:tetratricopeptide (TPR) repeat protein